MDYRTYKRYAATLPPPTTKKQQEELAQRRDLARANGDEEAERRAIELLVIGAQRLSLAIVTKHCGHLSNLDDCIRVALIGVWLSAKTWNPALGSFSTWISKSIYWTIQREIFQAEIGAVRISGGLIHTRIRLKHYRRHIFRKTGKYLSREELAERFKLSVEQVELIMQKVQFVPLEEELDAIRENNRFESYGPNSEVRKPSPFSHQMVDEEPSPEQRYIQKKVGEYYSNGYNLVLTERQRYCLDLWLDRNYNFSQSGEKLELSGERVSQIIKEALRRLRDQTPLHDWYEPPERRNDPPKDPEP